MKNYHGNDEDFQVGQRVIHVDDEGLLHPGSVLDIEGDLLHIGFDDLDEGWEDASTCFTEEEKGMK